MYIIVGKLNISTQKIHKRKNGRNYEYLVVWSGHDEETATWETADNLENAQDRIKEYETSVEKKTEAALAKKELGKVDNNS